MSADESSAKGSVARRRNWPWALFGLALLLLLVAAGIAWAGWHYSGGVVTPNHSPDPYTLRVIDVAPGRITLERDEGSAARGVYGLEWPRGKAQLGPVLNRDRERVVRELSRVSGPLRRGTEARIKLETFTSNPREARGLPYRDVEIPGELGPMPAWQVGGRSRTWAIVVHGLNGERDSGLRIAPALHAAGLTSLLISYRNDPGAPPSPDGLLHMGLTEWRDVEAAARFAVRRGARNLVLVGYSMGGAIVTQMLQRSPLADRVRAMILDAPALDWPAAIEKAASEMGLPFPGLAAKPVQWAIGQRIDVDWDRLDALQHTDQMRVPTLLLHGTADPTVPIEPSREYAEALPGAVQFEPVRGARHVQSWNVAPRRYEARIHDFLERVLRGAREQRRAESRGRAGS